MEIMHPHLRLAASLILAAGLVSACGGGGGSGTATPTPDPDPDPPVVEPTTERDPAGCTDASPTCTVTVTGADGTTTRTMTTNVPNAAMMTNTRTVTVGTVRIITVTSTNSAHSTRLPIEVRECTVSGDACTLTKLTMNVYTGSAPVVTTVTTYTGGRPTSRMVGDLTTNIAYFSNGAGRTETTVKPGGTLVQTFNQFTRGTATSTTFTSTNDLVVTENDVNADGHRRETTYASASDAMSGMNPVSVRVGLPAMTGTPAMRTDTGFLAGSTTTITRYRDLPASGLGVEAETYTKRVPAAGASATTETLVSRTYIRSDTLRETIRVGKVNSVDTEGARSSLTVTVKPTGSSDTVTTKTTTEYATTGVGLNTLGAVTKTTVEETDSDDDVVTTVVYKGSSGDVSNIVTTTITKPEASDGSRTVETTGGPEADTVAGDPMDGTTVRVRTYGDRTVTTTFTVTVTGATRVEVPSKRVETDANGIETMQVVVSNINKREVRTETVYRPDGTSTQTTETFTRPTTASATWTRIGDRVVVTRDSRQRTTLSVTTDSDGDVTDRTVTEYDAQDDSSTATRIFSGGTGDMLNDVHIVKKKANGDTISDVVMHPGVQAHAFVTDPQYETIQTGLRKRPEAKAVMGQAILHLDYAGTTAFNSFAAGTGSRDAEVEVITTRPSCTANKCTYDDLRHQVGTSTAPGPATEMRLYATGTSSPELELGGVNGLGYSASLGAAPSAYEGVAATSSRWETNKGSRNAKIVMHQLLADLLTVGGAGVEADYMAPTIATDADMRSYVANGALPKTSTLRALTGPKFEVESVSPAADQNPDTNWERRTFRYLQDGGLRGAAGIGQQVQEVNSYELLGGTRDDMGDDDVAAVVKVENYFGWMEHSMFTVRRVTATDVKGYNWVNDGTTGGGMTVAFGDDTSATVRAHFGMASGTPSARPESRETTAVSDTGIWTGDMIGVGSIQGERYRGDARITVKFANNNVTTAFTAIRLAQDSAADLLENTADRFAHVADELPSGITFTSTGGITAGGYTSDTLTGGVAMDNVSSLSGQFYGDAAEEVAGTFNAHGLAFGKDGSETMNRGDIVGAFGAKRDGTVPKPASN